MKNLILVTIFSIALISCKRDPEFLLHESGLKYYYHIHNSDGNYAKEGDILTLKMKYYTSKDSLLFDSDEINTVYRMQYMERSHSGGSIEDAYSLLRVGDSIRCKINALSFYTQTRKIPLPEGIDPTEDLIFDIKLKGIQSYSDIAQERQAARTNSAESEQLLLEEYLRTTSTKEEPTLSGLYFIELDKGNGNRVKPGDLISIHYVGKKIDQSIFDNSYKRNAPLQFTLGQNELIPGMEEGISRMNEKGKARLIIPSHLAYDSVGSGNVIPPYSTLIFEVEILSIQASR